MADENGTKKLSEAESEDQRRFHQSLELKVMILDELVDRNYFPLLIVAQGDDGVQVNGVNPTEGEQDDLKKEIMAVVKKFFPPVSGQNRLH